MKSSSRWQKYFRGTAASWTKYLDKTRLQIRGRLPAFLKRLVSHLETEAKDAGKVLRLTVRLSALSIAGPMAVAPDFWFQDNRLYLPSPIVPALAQVPRLFNEAMYAAALALCAVLLFFPQLRRLGFLLLPIFAFFVLQDQMRGHFYLEMCLFNLLAAASMPDKPSDRHLDCLRYLTVGTYFWSGFYKFNALFVLVGFPEFVSAWFPFRDFAQAGALFVPFLEAGVGICLLLPPARWVGQAVASLMLAVVLLSLGPLGRNEAIVVWPVNIYLDCLALFLFSRRGESLLSLKKIKPSLALAAVLLFCALPAVGMVDALGVNPTFRLYCTCGTEGSFVSVSPAEKLKFLDGELGREAVKNHRIAIADTTYQTMNEPPCNFLSGDKPIIDGARGFCPYLAHPDAARLHVLQPAHFWSLEISERVYSLCEKQPRLLSSGTLR